MLHVCVCGVSVCMYGTAAAVCVYEVKYASTCVCVCVCGKVY